MGAAPDELSLYRYRGEGWPGTAHMETSDGRAFDLTYEQAWLDETAPWKYDLPFRCKICPDAIGERADIAVPDGWVMKDGRPIYDEAPGVNLVITRTPKGAELADVAEADGALVRTPFTEAELSEMHDDHRARKTHWPVRMWALRIAGQPSLMVRRYRLISALRAAGFLYSLDSFLGTLRRARKKLNREIGFSKSI
jgi:coenzyme F420 hydrogenase subunit beta